MKEKVSIILPVYNREDTIRNTIDSVIQQTYKNFELIIIDDGSNDDSQKICSEYVQKDDRIKLIKKENGGPSQARNVGLEMANGKYLMFIDSDDEYKTNMIERMVTEIEGRASDVVVCNFNNRCNIKQFYNQTLEKGTEILQINYLFNTQLRFNRLRKRIFMNNDIHRLVTHKGFGRIPDTVILTGLAP